MSHAADIEILITALTATSTCPGQATSTCSGQATSTCSGQAVPEYTTPLPPYYPLLAQAQPLTLRDVVAQKMLLRDHDNEVRTQLYQVQKVMKACWQIPPTPLSHIPLGF